MLSRPDGKTGPVGIPTFEDKVAQRAIVMLLEPIYKIGLSGLLVPIPTGALGAAR